MRKLVFGLGLGLVSNSFAVQLEGNYLNANIGAAFQPNITYHATNNSQANGNQYLATENKRGGALDLSFGYQTEDLRAEVSGIYLENKIKKSKMRSTYFDITGTPNMGSTKVIGLMANGMYDFNSEADFTPYIGFGIGAVRITQNIKTFPNITATSTSVTTTKIFNDQPVTTTTSGTTTNTTGTIPGSTGGSVDTTTTTTTGSVTTTTYTRTTTVTTVVTPSVTSPSSGVTSFTGQPATTVTVSPPQNTSFGPIGLVSSNSASPVAGPSFTNAPSYSNGTQLQFAYQTILGMSYKIMDELKMSVDYRYLKALPSTFQVMDAGTVVPMKGSYSNHRLMLGLTAFF